MSKDAVKLAMTCLTYLNFDNFDVQYTKDLRLVTKRMEKYKFLGYCVKRWDNHTRAVEDDKSVLQLLQNFFSPTRTNQYLAWISSIVAISAVKVRSERAHGEQTTELDYNALDKQLPRMGDSSPLYWRCYVVTAIALSIVNQEELWR